MRPAEVPAKEGRMEKRAARPAGVGRREAVVGEGGSRRPRAQEGREAWASRRGAGGGGPGCGLGWRRHGREWWWSWGGSLPHRWARRVGAGARAGPARGSRPHRAGGLRVGGRGGAGAGPAGGGFCWAPRGSGGCGGGAGAVPASSRPVE